MSNEKPTKENIKNMLIAIFENALKDSKKQIKVITKDYTPKKG